MILNVFLTSSSFGERMRNECFGLVLGECEMSSQSSERCHALIQTSVMNFLWGAFHYNGKVSRSLWNWNSLLATSSSLQMPARVWIIYKMCFFVALVFIFNCVIMVWPPLQQNSEPFETMTKQGKDSDCIKILKVASRHLSVRWMCFQWVMVQRGAESEISVFFILLSTVGPIISYRDTYVAYTLIMLQNVAQRQNMKCFLCCWFCIESRVNLYFTDYGRNILITSRGRAHLIISHSICGLIGSDGHSFPWCKLTSSEGCERTIMSCGVLWRTRTCLKPPEIKAANTVTHLIAGWIRCKKHTSGFACFIPVHFSSLSWVMPL